MLDADRHLLLIGPRAAGKSTVGPRLSARLDRTFVDLDEDALAASGRASVREVFAEDGEAAWRELERRSFARRLEGPPGVLALGGGAPVHPPVTEAIRRLRRDGRGVVVRLDVAEAELVRRLTADVSDRPGLLGDDPVTEVREVLAGREGIYAELADVTVDAGVGPAETVTAILAALA